MLKTLPKSSSRKRLDWIAGRFATRYELRQLLTTIAGYSLVGLMPERFADRVFDRLVRRRNTRRNDRLDRDTTVERMSALLKGHWSDQDIRTFADGCRERRLEDMWGRWQASHGTSWNVRTEVIGLEHVTDALHRGSGVVFWGMSFCGTLFCKIALSRAGVDLTQLSTEDHGASYPLTMLGKRVVGPMYCLPEARYLRERIRIRDDGDNGYLKRIGEVLKNNGCIWIAGERSRVKKLIAAEMLGHVGHFPVGAPTLALRHNATLLPVYTERLGRFHYRVTIETPIRLDHRTRRNEVIDQAVQDYAQRLAARIIENPGDWDWDYSWVESLLTTRSTDYPQRGHPEQAAD